MVDRRVAYVLGCALALLAALRILVAAYGLPHFYDELFATTASHSFFHELNYRSIYRDVNFDPYATTGIAASWPLAIVWSFSGNLFGQRVLVALLQWIFFGVVTWLFFRRCKYSTAHCFLFTNLIWGILLIYPYWFGFVYGLGEFWGFLYLSASLLLLRFSPKLTFILWGVTVWLVKFYYLPVVLLWSAAYVLANNDTASSKVFKFLKCGIFIITPLLLWCTLIMARFGFEGLEVWARNWHQLVFVHHEGLKPPTDFSHRITSIFSASWTTYGLLPTIKLLLLALLPFGCFGLLGRKLRKVSSVERLMIYSSLFILIGYSGWFFLINPHMWARDYQPALYLGLGLSVYLIFKLHSQYVNRLLMKGIRLPIFITLVIILLNCFSLWAELRTGKVVPESKYAQQCTNPFLHRSSCFGENRSSGPTK